MLSTLVITLMTFDHTGTASCDGSTLSFNCSYCPNISNNATTHGCNGNCRLNSSNGVCEARGIHSSLKISAN